MSDLAESSLEPTTPRQWLLRVLLAIVAIALLASLALWLKSLSSAPAAAKRQVAKISILPDTPPPPPPPPPKQEPKPEPAKDEPKQAMREEQLKPELPKPVNEPIKMEGPAGDGPSAFAAGTVTREYQGGAPVVGAATAGGGNASDRAQERFYANSVRQLLRDEIEKNLRADAGELVANFAVWVEPDGSIRRFDLSPTGDAAHDADLRAAFEQTSRRLRLPGHTGLPQPMRFKLSLRPA
jgi:outer membrane biosynthesis protein TonB